MAAFWKKYGWIAATVVGSALFALGFSLFLAPNEINTGGLSGLAQIAVHVLGVGSIGSFTVVFNLPLFIAGRIRIGDDLLAFAGISGEVTLVGAFRKAQIWAGEKKPKTAKLDIAAYRAALAARKAGGATT